MNMVLKSMREATPSSGLLDSQNEKIYTSMLDQQLTQNLSGRGVGLAEAMLAQLQRSIAAAGVPDDGRNRRACRCAPRGLCRCTPQSGIPLGSSPSQAAHARSPAPAQVDLSVYQVNNERAGQRAPRPASLQGHVDQFVNRMGASAQAASDASGVPAPLILAQAALESGWGKREIRADDGTQSFNLFGIKADRSWKGPVVETTTTEYVDGEPQRVRAKFRAYASYDEAFTDYAQLHDPQPALRQRAGHRRPDRGRARPAAGRLRDRSAVRAQARSHHAEVRLSAATSFTNNPYSHPRNPMAEITSLQSHAAAPPPRPCAPTRTGWRWSPSRWARRNTASTSRRCRSCAATTR